ncbi:hypothetical protein VOLCADRAFT_90723 [Volvox carteri f. nagariensis]|uniref:Uncharacterized protein n=1 Tax=Volvox carteri f. nagariensis TaxID=3068 RepID=D8TVJ9_VOLCA|nr:uncharacterized protein VOLCADRAFT_90723 [Volvox carteri f. nagariensis]EFJ48469.1 hypothetical protein VOLCADRAFT_90723 [Volvox carteri f. nagariensis]|eukprot:XP_002950268.1 hypothetical protein VOLCADRAFT_90723 [Volvox carteri f. nagariensis]
MLAKATACLLCYRTHVPRTLVIFQSDMIFPFLNVKPLSRGAAMAPADGGMEASRRMHDYLLSKQRKQEEYWLRKYGRVLQAPPPSVGKPAANPRLPPIAGGSASGSGPSSSRGSNVGLNGEPSAAGSGSGGGLLPPVPGAQGPPGAPLGGLSPHHLRQPKGNAPIFRANEPVKDFFSRNVRQSRTSGLAMSRDEYGNMLQPSHRPPEPYRARGLPSQLPPMANYGQQHQQQQQHHQVSPETDEQPPVSSPQQQQQQQQAYNEPPTSQQQQQQQQQQQYQQHPYGNYPQAQYLQQQQQQQQQQQHIQQQQQQHHHHHHQQQASPRGGYQPPPRVGVPQPRTLPPLPGETPSSRSPPGSVGSGPAGRPLRSLEMELAVIRAIKAREDVLERLRIASGKLDSGFGGSSPVVLSPVDPLVRLFYRLVGTLRQRTLDVIEAIAAWRRKVNPADPFIYYGVDYLAAIGPDVGFLDELPFLRSRLTFTRAADDPFLSEVTPDGIPIEEATTCDLRRGGQRFSSEALRIRMARKVLAHYCGRALPGEASALSLEGGASTMSGGGLHAEPSQPRSIRSALTTGQGAEEEDGAAGGAGGAGGVVMTTEQIIRALSPTMPPVSALQPPAPRAITPPAEADSPAVAAAAAADSAVGRQREEEEEHARRDAAGDEAAGETALSVREAQEEEGMEAEGEQPVGVKDKLDGAPLPPHDQSLHREDEDEVENGEEQPTAAAIVASAELDEQAVPEPDQPPPPPPPPQVEHLPVFDNDNDFIDFALDAMIHSLEPPYVHIISPGDFTVAGWEIDHQLDEVVCGITSPERYRRTSIPGSSAAADAASALRLSTAVAAWPSPEPRSSSKIPRPPSEPKPPSGGRVSETTAAKPPSRGSRIPALPPSTARPPVRVHLNPRNSGLDMALSMDEEGPMAQASVASSTGRPTGPSGGEPAATATAAAAAAAARPPVRVHLSARNSGLDMALSMDEEELAAQGTVAMAASNNSNRSNVKPTAPAPYPEALPSILEDKSAFFGDADGEERWRYEHEGGAAEAGSGGTAGTAGTARPPVRVHLNPRNSGLDMALSMDEEELVAQATVASSTGRPTGRNSPGSSTRSSRSGVINPTGPNRYTEGLPSIHEDQGTLPSAADGGEQEDAGGGADRYRNAAGADLSAASTSRPPVRVYLRPNSRDINMVLSMEEDGMLMASPAVQDADAADSRDVAGAAVPPPLDDMPTPLQGPLSGRSNRASLRQGRQSGSRPSSAASGGPGGGGQE